MRKLIILFTILTLSLATNAQSKSEIRKWAASGAWANGFTKAKPDKTVNLETFYTQYHKNPDQWNALFQWLRDTDLLAIPKGKHPIPNSTLVASVEDSENEPLTKRGTESHRKKADFQYVVRGTEGFALLDHETSKASKPYDEKKDVIHYDTYLPEKTHFFDSKPGRFLIFFPEDWHIAKITTKKKDQNIRVIVVKVDYIE